MFDKNKVTLGLKSLVGFRPSSNPEFFVLTDENLQSDSGYYVNDNPFAEIESYYSTISYANIDEAGFNQKLEELKSSAITSVSNAVFSEKSNPAFCDRQLQFKNATTKINTETLPSGFICEKIRVAKVNSLAAKITRVMMDFEGTGDITLYLYNTNSIAPIKSQAVTIASDHKVVELDWTLDNTDGLNGGDWYIGYYTDGLTVSPYKRDYELSNVESKIKFINLDKTIVSGHTDINIWDLQLNKSTDITTGMNLDITTYYDYTDLIIQNRFLFADAINLDCAIRMLGQHRSSLRSNKDQRISEANLAAIEATLEGQSSDRFQKITGLRPSLTLQLDLIRRKIDALMGGYRTGRIKTVINV
jgi:hypothetical protein